MDVSPCELLDGIDSDASAPIAERSVVCVGATTADVTVVDESDDWEVGW